jgi:hypothetical protein
MPFVIPSLIKWTLVSLGGFAVLRWIVKEMRRVNEELSRVKASPSMDAASRRGLPTLRRDPVTGEWRLS